MSKVGKRARRVARGVKMNAQEEQDFFLDRADVAAAEVMRAQRRDTFKARIRELEARDNGLPMDDEDFDRIWNERFPDQPLTTTSCSVVAPKRPAIARPHEVGLRRHYFAYGSNLAEHQMKWRCPDSSPMYAHNLMGYKLQFSRFADIVPGEADDYVPGAMYLISKYDEAQLDRFEGVASGSYTKSTFPFMTPKGNDRTVLIYEKVDKALSPPTSDYLAKVTNGYRSWRLDMSKLSRALDEANGVIKCPKS